MTSAAWKWTSPLGGGVLLVLIASTVWAGSLNGRELQPSRSDTRASLFVVRRQVDGKITALDSSSRVVEVKTSAGKLTMTVRRPTTGSLHKGDSVLVELGILPSAPRALPPLEDQSQRGRDAAVVRKRLTARVTRVNVARGTLAFQTSAGPAELDLPLNILKRYQQGDTIPVELALIPRPPGAADRAEHAGLAALLLSIFGKK
jgi:hypothetical protein